jgi:hypothetical protein
MFQWLEQSLGHQQFDADVLDHKNTTVLVARAPGEGPAGFLPIQQPIMMESVALRPDLTQREQALVMSRLAEYAIEECCRRDAAEVYFLCHDPQTERFAQRHHFSRVPLPLYRFNLREQCI